MASKPASLALSLEGGLRSALFICPAHHDVTPPVPARALFAAPHSAAPALGAGRGGLSCRLHTLRRLRARLPARHSRRGRRLSARRVPQGRVQLLCSLCRFLPQWRTEAHQRRLAVAAGASHFGGMPRSAQHCLPQLRRCLRAIGHPFQTPARGKRAAGGRSVALHRLRGLRSLLPGRCDRYGLNGLTASFPWRRAWPWQASLQPLRA